jgi:hypothetical protein
MPYVDGRPLPGLPVDHQAELTVAYACGYHLGHTNANKEVMTDPGVFPIEPTVFRALLVDFYDGYPLYAFASECRPQPMAAGNVNFVCKDVWCVPFGVTDKIRFKWYVGDYPLTARCFDDPDVCPEVILEHDGDRTWNGSFTMSGGTLDVALVLTDTQDPSRPLAGGWPTVRKWEVTFSGCVDPPVTRQANMTYYYPLTGGGQYGGPLDTDCCNPGDAPDVAFSVEGFTNRYMLGQHVDQEEVSEYLSLRCCDDDPDCAVTECCGCDVSPYEWSLSVAGVANQTVTPPTGTACDCHNGTWTLGLTARNSVTGVCTWASEPGPCAGAPSAGMWQLSCDPGANSVTLSTQHTPGGGGQATYTSTLDNWDCMASNVLTLFSNSNHCQSWPATVTITPV